MELKTTIEEVWNNRDLLSEEKYKQAIRDVIERVDKGSLRTAMPVTNENNENTWQVNEWVKQAIVMYFGIQNMETYTLPPFEFYDKMKLKSNYKEMGVRAVPPEWRSRYWWRIGTTASQPGNYRRWLLYRKPLYCRRRCQGRKRSRFRCQRGLNTIH